MYGMRIQKTKYIKIEGKNVCFWFVVFCFGRFHQLRVLLASCCLNDECSEINRWYRCVLCMCVLAAYEWTILVFINQRTIRINRKTNDQRNSIRFIINVDFSLLAGVHSVIWPIVSMTLVVPALYMRSSPNYHINVMCVDKQIPKKTRVAFIARSA